MKLFITILLLTYFQVYSNEINENQSSITDNESLESNESESQSENEISSQNLFEKENNSTTYSSESSSDVSSPLSNDSSNDDNTKLFKIICFCIVGGLILIIAIVVIIIVCYLTIKSKKNKKEKETKLDSYQAQHLRQQMDNLLISMPHQEGY